METTNFLRAWTIVGLAVRAAIGLGINMRNDSTQTPNTSKEIRYRVWWSLYTLEHLLSIMTGRPTSIVDEVCTAPLPVPMEEEHFQSEAAIQLLGSERQKGSRFPHVNSRSPSATTSATMSTSSSRQSRRASKTSSSRSPSTQQGTPQGLSQRPTQDWAKNIAPNQSLYFLHYVQLTRITQNILSRLYVPTAMKKTWSEIQSTINELDAGLQSWRSQLPIVFDFGKKQRDQTFLRHRLCLGFFYYGTRITINRPCLCRLDRKIPNQSSKSRDFNRDAAAVCVESAKEMLCLIPDQPNAVGLNTQGPWWNILHFFMQAVTVLMLELAFRADHMPGDAENILDVAKKAVRWLHQMAEDSLPCRRAWDMCNNLLRDVASKVGRDAGGIPNEPPALSQQPIFTPMEMPGHEMSRGNDPQMMNPPLRHHSPYHGGFTFQQGDLVNPPTYSAYDEYLPYDQRTGELTRSLFPTSSEIDFMGDDQPQN